MNPDGEAPHNDVANEQRPVHVVAQVQADCAGAVLGDDLHITDGPAIGGIEVQADCARIAFAHVKRYVLDVVVEPVG